MRLGGNRGASPVSPDAMLSTIRGLGDSLTQGSGGGAGGDYLSQLTATYDRPTINDGIASQKSYSIAARAGGHEVTVSVANNEIPASGNVAVTILGPAGSGGQDVGPLAYAGGSSLWVTLAGIGGRLSVDGSINYTFARTQPGVAVACPSGSVLTVKQLASAYATHSLWIGRNNATDHAAVKADIAGTISAMVVSRYIVIGVLVKSDSSEIYGTQARTDLDALNAELAGLYGSRFLDINPRIITDGLTIAGIEPTAQDETDISLGRVPSSLRADLQHLNADGYGVVAHLVNEKLSALGW